MAMDERSIGRPPDPIEMLKEEHCKIECVLDGLEAMAEAASVGAFSDRDMLLEVLWFLNEFTDGRHHAKEEEYLFPVLEMLGLPVTGGPTGSMRLEHIQGRKLVSLAGSLLDPAFAPDGPDWKEIAMVCDAYAALLRAHIRKENHCVFGISREILGPTELDALGCAFRRVDRDWNARHGDEGRARVYRVQESLKRYVETLWNKA